MNGTTCVFSQYQVKSIDQGVTATVRVRYKGVCVVYIYVCVVARQQWEEFPFIHSNIHNKGRKRATEGQDNEHSERAREKDEDEENVTNI